MEAEWTLDAWREFVANRDAGAGMLWLLAMGLGLLVRVLPARFRAWAIAGIAAYALVMVLWLL